MIFVRNCPTINACMIFFLHIHQDFNNFIVYIGIYAYSSTSTKSDLTTISSLSGSLSHLKLTDSVSTSTVITRTEAETDESSLFTTRSASPLSETVTYVSNPESVARRTRVKPTLDTHTTTDLETTTGTTNIFYTQHSAKTDKNLPLLTNEHENTTQMSTFSEETGLSTNSTNTSLGTTIRMIVTRTPPFLVTPSLPLYKTPARRPHNTTVSKSKETFIASVIHIYSLVYLKSVDFFMGSVLS